MHAYLVCALTLWSFAAMALAAHLHGRWIEPSHPDTPTLAAYFVIMTALVVLGFLLLGSQILLSGSWLGLVASLPAGWLMAGASWHCDRWLVAHLGTRRGWGAAPPVAHKTGPSRHVGIAASQLTVPRQDGSAGTNRWDRDERAREARVGLDWLIIGAVLEELVYRGVLVRVAMVEAAWPFGMLLLAGASLAFALSHLPFGWAHVVAKLPLSLIALVLTLATGGVFAAVIGHAWFNIRVYRHYQTAFGGRASLGGAR